MAIIKREHFQPWIFFILLFLNHVFWQMFRRCFESLNHHLFWLEGLNVKLIRLTAIQCVITSTTKPKHLLCRVPYWIHFIFQLVPNGPTYDEMYSGLFILIFQSVWKTESKVDHVKETFWVKCKHILWALFTTAAHPIVWINSR